MPTAKLNTPYTWASLKRWVSLEQQGQVSLDVQPTPMRLDTRASSVVTGATNAEVHRSREDQSLLVTLSLSYDNSLSNANATTKNDRFAHIVTAIQHGMARSRQINEIHSVPM